MENIFHCKELGSDNSGNIALKICDNIMSCPTCLFIIHHRNYFIAKDIIEKRQHLPKSVTKIKLTLNPSDLTKDYFSFNGLDTIIYNLFRSENNSVITDLVNSEVYLKTYYQLDPIYTIPSIIMELYFFNTLKPKTIDTLWSKLKAEVLVFLGRIGDLETITIQSDQELQKLLNINFIMGYPEFKKEGVYLKHNFERSQLNEMNYLHTIPLQKLNMSDIVNNSRMTIFGKFHDLLLEKKIDKLSDEEIENILKEIFSTEEITQLIEDNLPF